MRLRMPLNSGNACTTRAQSLLLASSRYRNPEWSKIMFVFDVSMFTSVE